MTYNSTKDFKNGAEQNQKQTAEITHKYKTIYTLDPSTLRKRILGSNKTIYMPDPVIEELNKVAAENDITLSKAVVSLITKQLEFMRNR